MRLPHPCVVVLVGPSGSGKSTWAARNFSPSQIVSSDALRALVGTGEGDQRASTDAFDLLNDVVQRRLKRHLTTVVDTLGTEAKHRHFVVEAAHRAGMAIIAVVFDVDERTSRARNRARARVVPNNVVAAQWKSFAVTKQEIGDDGFERVEILDTRSLDEPVVVTAPDFVGALTKTGQQNKDPMPMRFGLTISRFDGPP